MIIQLTNLVGDIAPELRDRFYIVQLKDVAGYSLPTNCGAFAARRCNHRIRNHLESAGLWNGQKSLIALVDDFEPYELPGIAIHEISHLLPWVEVPEHEPTVERIAEEAELITALAGPEKPSIFPAWAGHCWKFIRTALHLHWRAEQTGLEIPLPTLEIGGARYTLPPAWEWRDALGDEPARMIGKSFDEILFSPPPTPFSNLWEKSK